MSDVVFTKDQQDVISSRDSNLLVAAAAGSGKTAVLVERIIRRISDPKDEMDIDRLLVVTFTNAAAREMQEKIRKAIEKAVESNPSDEHMVRQATLVHNASITTIDGFCMKLLRDYFHEIDIEPNFKVLDVGEGALLRAEAMNQLLESRYEEADENFLALSDVIASKGSDTKLEGIITKLYDASRSHPNPTEWLHQAASIYDATSFEELVQAPIFAEYTSFVKASVSDAYELASQFLESVQSSEVTKYIVETVESDLVLLQKLLDASSFGELLECCSYLSFTRAKSAPKAYKEYPETVIVKETLKSYREPMKAMMKSLSLMTEERLLREYELLRPIAHELVDLANSYGQIFAELKNEKNLLDFSDMEHLALKVLLGENLDEPTEVARSLQNYYAEVMVDEYQDSNEVQELLLSTLSGESIGKPNYFMVGDVKQSIYRFRMADPSIFNHKYLTYGFDDAKNRKIVLSKNFRSRPEILDTTNEIFREIMHEDIGRVEYDKQAELNFGAVQSYPMEGFPKDNFCTEILLGDSTKEQLELLDFPSKIHLEAAMIADKINQMKEELLVTDADTKELRPVRYSDIVILLRSTRSAGDVYVDALKDRNIPVQTVSEEGYFSAYEVTVVLSMLSVLDNPYQDIPLATVMHSPMFSVSEDNLSFIRSVDKKVSLYENLQKIYLGERRHGLSDEAIDQAILVYDYINDLRDIISDMSVHALIQRILDDTGFLTYVTALPGGDIRSSNLHRLIEEAVAYENTSFKGLFSFVNYIEKLKKYEVDYGVNSDSQDDSVKIMTIHKSKGLEFPVCFVSNLGAQFAVNKDLVLIHARYGLALDLYDMKNRVKYKSFYKEMMKSLLQMEDRGEELRVLYVALTRAKEKLILTGCLKERDEYLDKRHQDERKLSFSDRMNAKSYLDWIIPVLIRNQVKYHFECPNSFSMVSGAVLDTIEYDRKSEMLREILATDQEASEEVLSSLDYHYPYEEKKGYKNKYSVSELKHMAMEKVLETEPVEVISWADGGRSQEETAPAMEEESLEYTPIIPAFLGGEAENANVGALRGTAMHRFMECFNFALDDFASKMQSERERMLNKGLLTAEQDKLISYDKIAAFLTSPMAGRMHEAALRGDLFIEKAFVSGTSADELFKEEAKGEDELVLIQGIIDAFFREDGKIVLLDYKTDRISSPVKLADMYRRQLEIYSKAIEGAMELPVAEACLYSFYLNQLVDCNILSTI